jgi:hypothetical protein
MKILAPNENLSIDQFILSLIEDKSKTKIKKSMIIVSNNELIIPSPIIKNKPIKGSKLIKKENGIKIYKYPEN